MSRHHRGRNGRRVGRGGLCTALLRGLELGNGHKDRCIEDVAKEIDDGGEVGSGANGEEAAREVRGVVRVEVDTGDTREARADRFRGAVGVEQPARNRPCETDAE